jgi:hypothetical protein
MNATSLADWMKHRSALLGLAWPGGVAKASGVSHGSLDRLASDGNIAAISRSTLGYVARTMKVSVRELERFAAGRISWIDDARIFDLDRLSAASSPSPRVTIPPPLTCPVNRGTPILGRILSPAVIEPFDFLIIEDVMRIPIRYPGLPDVFAMEWRRAAEGADQSGVLVFLPLPPGEILIDDQVLLTHGCGEVVTEFVMIAKKTSAALHIASKHIPLENTHRAARVIGHFQR